MKLENLIYFEALLTCTEMLLMLVVVCVTLIMACRRFAYRFIIVMLLLLIVLDLMTGFLSISLALEDNKFH
jgi:hypothetical protein